MENKFFAWQKKMRGKSDKERHNYALTVSILVGCIALFFVISVWYYRIFGGDLQTSLFTEIEQIYREQKKYFSNV